MKLKNYILLTISTLTLAGCTSEDITNTPNDERIPLRIEATLSGDRPVTRAAGNEFEADDVLYSYVRHVYSTADLASASSYELASQACLVKFKKGSKNMVAVDASTNTTSDLTPSRALYWDDFSNSSVSTEDLNQKNHGLQSYYGYCYNGGTPTTPLNTTTGILGWTTMADQLVTDSMKHNDLLWSSAQTPVVYKHGSSKDDNHSTLTVPYSHAMSKFTIIIEAKDGFVAGDLEKTTVTLKDVSKVGEFNAPECKVTASDVTDVTMCPDGNTDATTRTYQAVTVPHTKLVTGKELATITDAGGNNYKITVTDEMLKDANWGDGLISGETQSGYNYQLTVTINKQKVSVVATLADWTPVTATGTGQIQFTADVADKGNNDSNLKNEDSFSLWRAKKVDDTTPVEADYGSTAVTYSFDGTSFSTLTPIYWPNIDDSYCFRALAEQTSEHTLLAVSDKTVAQGTDLFWGTSGADAIAPRTGDVPMAFEHAMSKMFVTLKTEAGDAEIDLTNATYEITNVSTSGTIALVDGVIKVDDAVTSAFTDGKSGVAKIMIPQTIGKDARLIINLHDGATAAESTTYSLQLNKCIDDNTKAEITKWVGGNQYSYTITLTKEEMKFRVLVQDWTPTTGSGNATLDWD